MVPRTSHIARPLPPSRPIPPTPPRGTIYVVERFGRFSRLLPGNGPPLLPLVDRVIAAYARRVDQSTPPEGLLALLAGSRRVLVNANWSIRVADPRKLAYRVSDVDRCVDMLIHVRIRDTFSTLPHNIDIHDPAVLNRISDAIRHAVDTTAARFGVSCPQFKILALRLPDEKPQRSLNLAETIHTSDYYANEIDTVLPELPRDATPSAINSLSSVPPVPQPAYINYPQPIAYPQPVQPTRKQPALANVRLPPPQPAPHPSDPHPIQSDDDSLIQLHNSHKIPESQSFRELPTVSSEHHDTHPVDSDRTFTRSRSLPQLIMSDDDESAHVNRSPSESKVQSSCGEIRSSDDETLKAAKSVLAMNTTEQTMNTTEQTMHVAEKTTHPGEKTPPISEDEGVHPVVLPSNAAIQELLVQDLPRDISSLTDEIPPVPLPQKREILYAPPPSPIASNGQASSSSVSPKLLSDALASDIKKPSSGAPSESTSSSSERAFVPPQTTSPPLEQSLPQVEHVSPSQEQTSPLLERILHASGRKSSPPEHVSPPPERVSPPPERISPPPERISPPPEQGAPALERSSPPLESNLTVAGESSLSTERGLAAPERALPPTVLPAPLRLPPSQDRGLPAPEATSTSHSTERAVPSLEQSLVQTSGSSPLPERLPPTQLELLASQERNSPVAPASSSSGSATEGLSPPLANIFKTAAPTPRSELPSSERESDSPSDGPDARSRPSPQGSPTERAVSNSALDNPASESPTEFKDALDHPVPSPLMLAPGYRPSDSVEGSDQITPTVPSVRSASNAQGLSASQPRQAPTSFPLRSGMPLLGPPMIPEPRETLRERQPAHQSSAASVLGPQTATTGMAPQGLLSPTMPPRAPTPPTMPPGAPGYSSAGTRHRAPHNVLTSPVMAEGLGFATPSGRPLPTGVGGMHAAEVNSRVRHAIPRTAQQQDRAGGRGQTTGADISYGSTEPVNDEFEYNSDDTNVATRSRPRNSSPTKKDQRKRRQQVQTTSLFSATGGKGERAIKPTGASAGKGQPTERTVRAGMASHEPHLNPETIREGSHVSEVDPRYTMSGAPRAESANSDGLKGRTLFRSEGEYDRDDAHLRRDGKRLRTAEEQEHLYRKERSRRDKQMNDFDMTHRKSGAGRDSSSEDSTKMMVDEGSDEERERFNESVMSQSGTHSRRRRQKTRHRRHHARRIDHAEDSDDSSSDNNCTECGRHHEGHGHSTSQRRGKSRSRSRRSDSHDRSDDESETRSVSRSRSGRERKSTSEASVDSNRSARSSSRDHHRSKKSSSRDRKIEKTSSSSRSRSRDGKRSHSKSRSSSRKRDVDDKRRKDSSKSKSRNRDKREVPTQEQLEYRSRKSGLQSIYRHRLPESDSGPENPIPWYCEGQSEPEDTDLEDYEGPGSSDSDVGKKSRSTTIYSSYGRRDRHGRRHRAHHNRNVTFLYDNRR